MRLNSPSFEQIATVATQICGLTVTQQAVKNHLARLQGRAKGNGRLGPVGLGYTALKNPVRGVAAAILLAMDDLGMLATAPLGKPWHDPERAFLAAVAAVLRSGRIADIEQKLDELAILYSADPEGQGRIPAHWNKAPRPTRGRMVR